ncbi:MAG: GAF domain-containing protein [Microcoleaceae cyanobacterium]
MSSHIIPTENKLMISAAQLQKQLKQERAITEIMSYIRDSLELETIFQKTISQIRQLLEVNRVTIFQFNSSPHRTGKFICEDATADVNCIITQKPQTYLIEKHLIESDKQSQIQVINNIHHTQLNSHFTRSDLTKLQVQASIIAPLHSHQKLWGLLCIHQCHQPRDWQESEIELIRKSADCLRIALQQTESVKQIKDYSTQLTQITQRDQVIGRIVDKIRPPLDIITLFEEVTQEIRQLLNADRVAIFQFNPDWSGDFVAESVAEGWTPLVGIQPAVEDTYLQRTKGGRYAEGHTFTVNDIYQAGLSPCHIQLLEQLQAKSFATAAILQGERLWGIIAAYQNSATRIWHADEVEIVSQIGQQIGIALRHNETLSKAEYKAEQQKALTEVITRIRKSWDLSTIFETTVTEVRQLLKVDRVSIVSFDPEENWEGEFIYEDVADEYDSALREKVYDHCFNEKFVPLYYQGRINAINDIYKHQFQDCYLQILERFQVRANVVAPLLRDNQLWGLLCIHQCRGPRCWQESEIEFIRQISEQLSVALNQSLYYQQVQAQAIQLAEATEREKAMQRQKLLSATIDKIRQSLELKTIFKSTTQAVRELLQVERVAIYQFNLDWTGKFVADSFQDDWSPVISAKVTTEPNILAADNHDELPRNETFVPISQGEKLWGLLVAYQNSKPRYWQKEEVNLLAQVGVQLGIAIQQAELLETSQCQAIELAKALKELKQTQAQLIQGEKMASLGQLVAGVAHEINNPVNFIYGNLTYLQEYVDHLLEVLNLYNKHSPNLQTEIKEKIEEYDLEFILKDLPKTVNSMKMGTERIRQIVLSLRNFSRKDESASKRVDIHEGLESTLLILGNRFKSNDKCPEIKIIKEYDNLPLVECYPAQLNQVFMNLLSNSVDAIQDKFKAVKAESIQQSKEVHKIPLNIWITTKLTAEKITIIIRDNGIGMSEIVRQKIFDPFFTTKEVGQGTGLGLPISYQIIVEKHQGKIQCFSQPDQGTEFVIEIPIKLMSR